MIFRAVKPLCDTVMADACHHTFVKTQRMHSAKGELLCYILRVITACQCRVTDCNKPTTLGVGGCLGLINVGQITLL